jgi:archaellum component FlaC
MGYYIKYRELESVQDSISNQINKWNTELENAKQKIQEVAFMQELKGATAHKVRLYMMEIHIPLINFLQQVLVEFKARLLVYSNDYYVIDSNANAKIAIDRLDEQITNIRTGMDAFQAIEESVSNAIGMVAGLASVSVPSGARITNNYERLDKKVTKLKNEVGECEYNHLASDLGNVEDMLYNILQIIDGQSGNSKVTITSFHVGSVAGTSVYKDLLKAIDTQQQFLNSDKCKSAIINVENRKWTKVDDINLEKSNHTDKVYISESGKYILYHGLAYPIYVPDYTKQAYDMPWTTIETKKYSKVDFDWGMAFWGISWDDVEEKELRTSDYSYKLKDKNAIGQAWVTVLNLVDSGLKALENTTVTINFEEANGNKRAIISVYNSRDAQTLSSLKYNTPISKRNEQKKITGPGPSLDMQSDYAKGIGELVTGKKYKDGIYDIEITLDERHKTQGTTGFLSYDANGRLLYTPVVFGGDKAVVGTHLSVGIFETDFEPIVDFSDYLKQPSYASEDYQKVLEKVLLGD